MDTGFELIEALRQIEREKGIDGEVLFTAIEAALVAACKKNYEFDTPDQEVRVVIDRKTGKVGVYVQKDVVEHAIDDSIEISLSTARKIHPAYEIGDVCDVLVTPRNFGRIAAQTAKQIVTQKIRDAEREKVYTEFKEKEHKMITGVVMRKERGDVIVEIGKNELMLRRDEQIDGEDFMPGERIKLYVVSVERTTKSPRILISRSHPDIVKRLFEQESPEVEEGVVEIVCVAREAGQRAKIAVRSNNANVDPVGACVGANGYRVNAVVKELRGERVDIVEWKRDPRMFIAAALSPAEAVAVMVDPEDERKVRVVVPDNKLSLAIGKQGQNVRLAARLTGFKIDIRDESAATASEWVPASEYMPRGGYMDGRFDSLFGGVSTGDTKPAKFKFFGMEMPDDEDYERAVSEGFFDESRPLPAEYDPTLYGNVSDGGYYDERFADDGSEAAEGADGDMESAYAGFYGRPADEGGEAETEAAENEVAENETGE